MNWNWIGIFTTALIVVNILVCLLLIFVVLLQRPKNEGLGAAFGGDTASNIFGAQTTNVLATLTRWLGGLFLGLCLIIAILGKFDSTKIDATREFLRVKQVEREAEAAKLEADKKINEDAKKKAGDAKATPAAFSPAVPAPDPNKPVEATPTPAPSTPPAGTPPAATPAPGTNPQPASTPAPPATPPADLAKPTPAPEPAKTTPDATKPAAPTTPAPEPAKAPAPEPAKAPDAPKPAQ